MKDSFRIIMTLVAHYDLELHQMDVKTAFLNGDIEETIYMVQPENFESKESKHLVYKLKKSIYSLKQASRQWNQKFDKVITSFGSKENIVDQCIYQKISKSKFILMVLNVDDIMLASSDIGPLYETKRFLSNNFEMKDLGNASFVLGIQIYRDHSRGILAYHKRHILIKCLVDLVRRIVHQEIPPLLRVINSICFNAQRMKLRRKRWKTSFMHQQ